MSPSNSPPPPQTISPSALQTQLSSPSPRYESAIDLDTQTGLSPPAKRVKTSPSPSAEYPLSEGDNWEDESPDEGEEQGDSEDEGSSEGEYIIGLPRAQLNSNHNVSNEEVEMLLSEVRSLGGSQFLRKYISVESKFSLHDLLYAFGYKIPEEVEVPTETMLALVRMAVETELRKRKKLEDVNTVDDVVDLIKKSNNIMILAGAGISTSCGIPDFRSNTGIYAMLADHGLDDPHDMFDIEVFRHDPTIFYSFARKLLPQTHTFSPTHAFLSLLQDHNKLLRVYTQNIDNLEQLAGVREDKLVQCHGSFATASCMRCRNQVPGEKIREEVLGGEVPKCEICEEERKVQEQQRKKGKKRKNGWDDDEDDDEDEDDDIIEGIMKPDITFFGEQLFKKFDYTLLGRPGSPTPDTGDIHHVDLLICIGTSLKVAPVSEIIGVLPPHVPQIYISKTPCHHIQFDTTLLGNCDHVVRDLVRRCGYRLKHGMLEGGRSDVGEGCGWRELERGVWEVVEAGNQKGGKEEGDENVEEA